MALSPVGLYHVPNYHSSLRGYPSSEGQGTQCSQQPAVVAPKDAGARCAAWHRLPHGAVLPRLWKPVSTEPFLGGREGVCVDDYLGMDWRQPVFRAVWVAHHGHSPGHTRPSWLLQALLHPENAANSSGLLRRPRFTDSLVAQQSDCSASVMGISWPELRLRAQPDASIWGPRLLSGLMVARRGGALLPSLASLRSTTELENCFLFCAHHLLVCCVGKNSDLSFRPRRLRSLHMAGGRRTRHGCRPRRRHTVVSTAAVGSVVDGGLFFRRGVTVLSRGPTAEKSTAGRRFPAYHGHQRVLCRTASGSTTP